MVDDDKLHTRSQRCIVSGCAFYALYGPPKQKPLRCDRHNIIGEDVLRARLSMSYLLRHKRPQDGLIIVH